MKPSDQTWATQADADPSATIRPESSAPPTEAMTRLLSRPGGRAELDFGDTIGTGGMGVVRLAEQPRLGRTVAVKSLRDGGARADATQRLVQEAWITGRLEHPNIVPIYDIAVDEQQNAHILMKRISGIQWGAVMDDAAAVFERFGTKDLLGWNLGILATICNAVDFAHSRGILHRDLKPDNVMIGEFGEVYVVDWGIAVALEQDGRLPTLRDRRIAGTPRYMAPEMVEGRFAGVPTDVYLLGGLLHRILTGSPPHRGWSIKEILGNIAGFEPVLPPQTAPDLARLLHKAMAAEPSARMPTASQFRQELMAFQEHRSSNQLARQAEQHRASLSAELGAARDRTALYEHLAACRFGYAESLRSWSDNPTALKGWQSTLVDMIHYEIGCREPRAARLLLADLPCHEPAIEAELQALERAKLSEDRELRGLALDHDERIGARTRLFFAGVLGISWVVLSVVGHFWLQVPSLETHIVYSCVIAISVTLFFAWARESLMATVMNRATASLMIVTPTSQVLLHILLWMQGVEPAVATTIQNFLFVVVSACATVLVERRLVATVFGFTATSLACAVDPAHGLLYTAFGVTIFTVTLVWLWLPGLPTEPTHRPSD